jgi:hypothetical protein
MNLSDMPQTEPLAPEKPPKQPTSGGCCSKLATFLGLEPRAVFWFAIGSLRFELGATLSRRPSRSTEST